MDASTTVISIWPPPLGLVLMILLGWTMMFFYRMVIAHDEAERDWYLSEEAPTTIDGHGIDEPHGHQDPGC